MSASVSSSSTSASQPDSVVGVRIRVAVVDDHELLRGTIRRLLDSTPDMEWVGEAGDGADALALVAHTHPDVVLMDLSMPGMDGLTATHRIIGSSPLTSVLVLTSSADPDNLRLSREAGATGVIGKDGDPETILAGIRSAVRDPDPHEVRTDRQS